jgi:hypothetical protein
VWKDCRSAVERTLVENPSPTGGSIYTRWYQRLWCGEFAMLPFEDGEDAAITGALNLSGVRVSTAKAHVAFSNSEARLRPPTSNDINDQLESWLR